MAVRNLFAGGIGFTPGSLYFMFTAGLGSGPAPAPPLPPVGPALGFPLMTVVSYTALRTILEAADTANLFDTCTINLMKTNVFPSPGAVPGDFTPADYDGYAPAALGAFTATFANLQGDIVAEFPHAVFQPTGSVVSNIVYGWWIQGPMGGGSDVLIAAGMFPNPITLSSPLTVAIVEARIPLGQPLGS